MVRIFSHSDLYSVRMRENADQNNSEYGHFQRSVVFDPDYLPYYLYVSFDCDYHHKKVNVRFAS